MVRILNEALSSALVSGELPQGRREVPPPDVEAGGPM